MDDIKNIHKVPKRQWKKWTNKGRHVFNELYEDMLINQWIFIHPETPRVRAKYWKTTAWNAAWMAAEALRKED